MASRKKNNPGHCLFACTKQRGNASAFPRCLPFVLWLPYFFLVVFLTAFFVAFFAAFLVAMLTILPFDMTSSTAASHRSYTKV
jgi:hypothetical protein